MTIKQAQSIIHSPFFRDFLAPAADRGSCITEQLSAQHIPYHIVTLQNKKHIVLTYGASAYDSRFRMKTIIAHYDRAFGSPGANDNSASCAQLLAFAKTLLHRPGVHNIRIIFTDGEEAGAQGIEHQGAYRLGQGLRALAMQHADIFVFDMCGRGDTLILSESGMYGRDNRKTAALIAFHQRCCAYADSACRGQWLSLPTAYSDNAGLISAGLTAQVITILPRQEAVLLAQHIQGRDTYAAAGMGMSEGRGIRCTHKQTLLRGYDNAANPVVYVGNSGQAKPTAGREQQNPVADDMLEHYIITNAPLPLYSPLAAVIPATWQRMHTVHDSLESLTPQAFVLVDKMLRFLADVKERVTPKGECSAY